LNDAWHGLHEAILSVVREFQFYLSLASASPHTYRSISIYERSQPEPP